MVPSNGPQLYSSNSETSVTFAHIIIGSSQSLYVLQTYRQLDLTQPERAIYPVSLVGQTEGIRQTCKLFGWRLQVKVISQGKSRGLFWRCLVSYPEFPVLKFTAGLWKASWNNSNNSSGSGSYCCVIYLLFSSGLFLAGWVSEWPWAWTIVSAGEMNYPRRQRMRIRNILSFQYHLNNINSILGVC